MIKKLLKSIPILGAIAISALATLGFFASDVWIFDLFSHFQFQYFIFLTVSVLIIAVYKWRLSLLFIPFLILTGTEFIPLYFGGRKVPEEARTIKLLSINLLSSNGQFEQVINYIETKDPDILILQEYTELWHLMIAKKLDHYNYRKEIQRSDNFGIAVFSKVELNNLMEIDYSGLGLPSIIAKTLLDNIEVWIIATHTVPPVSQEYFDSRNNHFSPVALNVKGLMGPTIVVGDLNTTSFSKSFKKFLREGGLIDSRKGFGLQTTWPTWFWPASITLDHFLHTEGIFIKDRQIGVDVGSDHLPIYVEFGIGGSE